MNSSLITSKISKQNAEMLQINSCISHSKKSKQQQKSYVNRMKEASSKKINKNQNKSCLKNLQNVALIKQRLIENKKQLESKLQKINRQVQQAFQQQERLQKFSTKKQKICKQKRVDIIPEQSKNFFAQDVFISSNTTEHEQNLVNKSRDIYISTTNNHYLPEKQFKLQIMPNSIYYPPSCSAYDITYCKSNDCIYIYGGISCTAQLQQGLNQYFYKYQQGQWKQIKPVSLFTPMPRYGHTLTATADSLLLFGGVSEYKQKLKDRCFYPDVWSFNINKNNWKVLQFSGIMIKNRKSHAACLYGKYYIIYGGIDDCEEVIGEICWVNMDERKGRWRTRKIDGRYNHQIVIHQSQQGRDYLFVFGGRNSNSQIISEFIIYPIYTSQGQLHLKQPIRLPQKSPALLPCQFPIMKSLQSGILIIGGINSSNEAVNQCWFYNVEKQYMEQVTTMTVIGEGGKMESRFGDRNNRDSGGSGVSERRDSRKHDTWNVSSNATIDWKELRGAKAVSLNNRYVYILAGTNSKKYKAVRVCMYNPDQEFKFRI